MDWTIASNIAAPILALFVGAWIDRRLEARAKLVAFYGHVSAFKVRPEGAEPFHVFTHSVVVRNVGRRPATRVRISHQIFPDNVTVQPDINYEAVDLPDGGKDLVIETLVPKQQVTISYLYYPPVNYSQVNNGVRSNEGFAEVLNVLPMVPPKVWVARARTWLAVVGVVACVYIAYEMVAGVVRGAG